MKDINMLGQIGSIKDPASALRKVADEATFRETDEKGDGRSPRRGKSSNLLQTGRMTLDFPPAAAERLAKLKEDTESATYAEVIRDALRLYAGLVEDVRNGAQIVIREKDGSEYVVRLFV